MQGSSGLGVGNYTVDQVTLFNLFVSLRGTNLNKEKKNKNGIFLSVRVEENCNLKKSISEWHSIELGCKLTTAVLNCKGFLKILFCLPLCRRTRESFNILNDWVRY